MPDGGHLSVKTSIHNIEKKEQPLSSDDSKKCVQIKIKDSGSGIKAGEMSKIFEPFYSTKKKGSGLGLSTTYNIISDHKGLIKVDSQKNQGTLITLSVPLEPEQSKTEFSN